MFGLHLKKFGRNLDGSTWQHLVDIVLLDPHLCFTSLAK